MSLEDVIREGLADMAKAIREGNAANAEQHAKSLAVVAGKRDGQSAGTTAAKETKKALKETKTEEADKAPVEQAADEDTAMEDTVSGAVEEITFDQLLSVFKVFVAKHKRAGAEAMFKEFDLKTLSDATPDQYQAIQEYMENA